MISFCFVFFSELFSPFLSLSRSPVRSFTNINRYTQIHIRIRIRICTHTHILYIYILYFWCIKIARHRSAFGRGWWFWHHISFFLARSLFLFLCMWMACVWVCMYVCVLILVLSQSVTVFFSQWKTANFTK